jgi:hypothetical protein
MNATAALTAVPSTETYGLPDSAARLIAKLRVMDPALRASILTTKETTE